MKYEIEMQSKKGVAINTNVKSKMSFIREKDSFLFGNGWKVKDGKNYKLFN